MYVVRAINVLVSQALFNSTLLRGVYLAVHYMYIEMSARRLKIITFSPHMCDFFCVQLYNIF